MPLKYRSAAHNYWMREMGNRVSQKPHQSRTSQQPDTLDVERGNTRNDGEGYITREETKMRLRSPPSWENLPNPQEDTKANEGEANTTQPISSVSINHHGDTPQSTFDYTCVD